MYKIKKIGCGANRPGLREFELVDFFLAKNPEKEVKAQHDKPDDRR